MPLSGSSPLILLADDQPALSAITRDYLESVGMRVEVAFDGQEALQKATALLPDLIMMDVQMPVMDGLEAIRQIRQSAEPRLREVPIICLSGLAVAGDMEKCIAAGATAYLAKPFGVQQLQRAIRSFLPLP
jgi:CheY-like chemotaxis protein